MTYADQTPQRRRRWPIFVPAALLLVAAAAWTVFWFYAASEADLRFEEWRTREARAGRVYECADRSFGGYPFRFEIRCGSVSASFIAQTPLSLHGAGITVVAQAYTPALLIAELKGPLTIGEQGRPPMLVADWKLAEASVRGLPTVPQRISMVWDEPVVSRLSDNIQTPLFRAMRTEVHGRLSPDSLPEQPVIEVVTRVNRGAVQDFHPLLAQPFDSTMTAKLRGLRDVSPKPWPARFREIQAAGGRIEVVDARFEQGQTLAVGNGSLGLSPAGRLDGELKMIVVGMEAIVPQLGIDRLLQQGVSQSQVDRVVPGVNADDVNKVLGAIDRIIPGLGNIARQQANAGLTAGLNMLGEKTTLDGKPALAFPLRFVDGTVSIGPLKIAETPSLF